MALNRENVIRAAEKYVSKGKLEAAIKEYRKVLAENPNDANTLNRVGDLYARIERFDEAVRLFSQIAEQYTRDGFFVKAIAIYKKIIKLDPTSLTVYERLAELYHKQGLLNEARTQYQVLADYYQKHDNAASAITIYQRMAEFEPDNPTFHLKLAELYESQRLIDKAMKEYRFLADLLIVGGSVDEAAQVYLKALEVNPTDLTFVRDSVQGLHDTGHVAEAAKVLARAVELNPAAAELAQQVGLGQTDDIGLDESEEEAPVTPGFETSDPSQTGSFAADDFATDETFAVDDAFHLEETSFEDMQDSLEETHATASAAAEAVAAEAHDDDEVFTFDLDDDEVPESLVTPPSDMLEEVRTPAAEGSVDEDDEESFDLSGAFDFGDASPPVEPVSETAPQELEIDWPADEMEELELPGVGEEAGSDAEPVFDLDETVPAQRLESDAVPLSLDAFELNEPSLEPVEHSLEDGAPEFGDDLEIELEPIDLEEEIFEVEEPDALEIGGELTDEVSEDESAAALGFDERREEDLLAEAKVFAKYGLQEKARDRLTELFQIRPDHLEGLALQTGLDLEAGQHAEVVANANLVSRIAGETGQSEFWVGLRGRLDEAGFVLEGDRVIGEPGANVGEEDRIAQLLDDLSLETFDTPVTSGTGQFRLPGAVDELAEPEPEAEDVEVVEPIAEVTEVEAPELSELEVDLELSEPEADEEFSVVSSSVESPVDASVAEQVAEQVAESPDTSTSERKLISLVDELGLDDLEDRLDGELAVPVESTASAAEPPASPADPLDETGMSWLDDLETEDQESGGDEEKIFDEEDDFFDLAAELERELSEDDGQAGGALQPQEQSLEDIIEGFKQGVAEHLSPEDYDTHFNLGIAYREMGLLDEAIGEFQLAAKDERYVVDSSSLLGICFLDKGLPELAVRSYRKGLEAPSISDDATLGLLYDMGAAYQTLGDAESAYKTFIEVYGLNSHYRDVVTKLEELKAES